MRREANFFVIRKNYTIAEVHKRNSISYVMRVIGKKTRDNNFYLFRTELLREIVLHFR